MSEPSDQAQSENNNIYSRRSIKRLKEILGDSQDVASASALFVALTLGFGVAAPIAVPIGLGASFVLKVLDRYMNADDEDLEEELIDD